MQFYLVNNINMLAMLRQTILGINSHGAIFEKFQVIYSGKKIGTSNLRIAMRRFTLR